MFRVITHLIIERIIIVTEGVWFKILYFKVISINCVTMANAKLDFVEKTDEN